MFKWSKETIQYQLRAIKQTDYYKKAAEIIAANIKDTDTVYDIGCGLGYLSLELSRYVKSIIAIDIEPMVIENLSCIIKKDDIKNIQSIVSDWREFKDQKRNVLIACSFGVIEENWDYYRSMAESKVIIIKRVGKGRGNKKLCTEFEEKYTAESEERFIKSRGLRYKKEIISTQFGQPFKNLYEVEDFIDFYKIKAEGVMTKDFIKKNVIETNDKEYPYFMPNNKEFDVMIIDID